MQLAQLISRSSPANLVVGQQDLAERTDTPCPFSPHPSARRVMQTVRDRLKPDVKTTTDRAVVRFRGCMTRAHPGTLAADTQFSFFRLHRRTPPSYSTYCRQQELRTFVRGLNLGAPAAKQRSATALRFPAAVPAIPNAEVSPHIETIPASIARTFTERQQRDTTRPKSARLRATARTQCARRIRQFPPRRPTRTSTR